MGVYSFYSISYLFNYFVYYSQFFFLLFFKTLLSFGCYGKEISPFVGKQY